MNKLEKSINILGLHGINEMEIDENILKRQYHKKALLYHPDKNLDSNASDKFQDLHTSYEYIMKHYGYLEDDNYDINENNDYNEEEKTNNESWFSYLYPFLQSEIFLTIQSKLLHSIISQLYSKCEQKAYDLINKLDTNQMEKIILLLKTHQPILRISDDFVNKIELLHETKLEQTKTIVIRPNLKDLIDEQLYKLIENDQLYYIPLWHHELIYDVNGHDLYIEINPILDENFEIDDDNNIIVYKQYFMEDIWSSTELLVYIGNRTIKIPRDELKMRPLQKLTFISQGIPRISSQNIYDVSKKSNIIVIIMIIL